MIVGNNQEKRKAVLQLRFENIYFLHENPDMTWTTFRDNISPVQCSGYHQNPDSVHIHVRSHEWVHSILLVWNWLCFDLFVFTRGCSYFSGVLHVNVRTPFSLYNEGLRLHEFLTRLCGSWQIVVEIYFSSGLLVDFSILDMMLLGMSISLPEYLRTVHSGTSQVTNSLRYWTGQLVRIAKILTCTLSILVFYLRMEIPFYNCCDGLSITR